jgi:hypothetical protein
MGTKTQKLSNVVDQIVEWQSVFTGDGSTGLTAVAGRGYFIDTTSGTVTVTLPASPKAGDIVQLKDYARTWGTNAVSTSSALFDGLAAQTPSFSTNGQTITLVYMDGTKGWSLINDDTATSLGAQYVTATGGTVTESGDYKIHTFTGDGTFCVSSGGNPGGSDTVDYLVVAGGGGSGSERGAGGGGGGYRESSGVASGCYTVSPLGACVAALPVSATSYPVTVGGGGGISGPYPPYGYGLRGSNSVFSTITSTGGGGGAGALIASPCQSGGSGGGGAHNPSPPAYEAGGTGNTPPVSPPQGNTGGSSPGGSAGGGGGAGATGCNGTPTPGSGGRGGAGVTSSINGTPTTRAGGGRGGAWGGPPGAQPNDPGGGPGGGGLGGGTGDALDGSTGGTANTGGGAGGGGPGSEGGSGGKGIVIIRYKFQ